jgi:hypothetical protein
MTATTYAEVTVARGEDGTLEVSNGRVHLRLSREHGSYQELLRAGDGEGIPVFRSGNQLRADPSLMSDGAEVALKLSEVRVMEESAERAVVVLTGEGGGHFVRKTLTLERGSPALQVVVRDSVPGVAELSYLLSTYTYLPCEGRPDFVWTPQLRPDVDDVIADHTFRTPALILQHGGVLGALIPDVRRIQPWRSVQTAGDLQVNAPGGALVSYGAINWRQRSHVFYTHSDKMTTQLVEGRFEYGYRIFLSPREKEQRGYSTLLRWLWEELGRPNLLTGKSPQTEPLDAYVHKAWYEYVPQVATDTTYRGTPITLLSQERLSWSNKLPPAANRDAWFTVWFSSLRTSVGMYLDGVDSGDTALKNRAIGVLNLALLAPEREGLSPSIFYLDSAGGHWVGDQGWGGIGGGAYYSMFANCWTGTWLLAWADLLPERREEILRRTRRLGDFLLSHQQPSGVVPSWFDPETLQAVDTFRTENAETAGAALFLAELSMHTGQDRYLKGARRAMSYLQKEIIPSEKWFDFETFFSCSRKPLEFFDAFTAQYPQNTLSIHQAAEAALALFRATGEEEYRSIGIGLIDYLCLYQQLWSPGWLSRRLFGGFGVQNTDGEWSDSRQGYFAVTLGKYYELTGEREYLERAVAALRAMFSLFESPDSPRAAENYAHSAIDRLEGVTGLHWGTGSSTVAIHLLRARFGDLFIDAANGWGVGLDGCTVTRVLLEGNRLSLDVQDFVGTSRSVTLKCAGLVRDAYGIVVNGKEPLKCTRSQLERGVAVVL